MSECILDPNYYDTWLLCSIFENSNMTGSIAWWDSAKPNYCDWLKVHPNITESFNCIGNVTISVLNLDIDGIDYCIEPYSIINTSLGWPQSMEKIDLDHNKGCRWFPYSGFGGIWHFSSMSNMNDLKVLDIESQNFDGYINNMDWNMILTELPNLDNFDIGNNNFYTNFSEISINKSSNIRYFYIDRNNFYGKVSIDNFLTKFPVIRSFYIYSNELGGHFNNFDFMTTMSSLIDFRIYFNEFTGSVKLSSSDVSLPISLQEFDIESNNFSYIDWSIFSNLENLRKIDVEDMHNFVGMTIDWSIIGNLSYYNLIVFDAVYTEWGGFADFTTLNDSITIILNVNYLCDPSIYVCLNGSMTDRTDSTCYGKIGCESTCRCSDGSIPETAAPTTTGLPTGTPTGIPTAIPTTNTPTFVPTITRLTSTQIATTNIATSIPIGTNLTSSTILPIISSSTVNTQTPITSVQTNTSIHILTSSTTSEMEENVVNKQSEYLSLFLIGAIIILVVIIICIALLWIVYKRRNNKNNNDHLKTADEITKTTEFVQMKSLSSMDPSGQYIVNNSINDENDDIIQTGATPGDLMDKNAKYKNPNIQADEFIVETKGYVKDTDPNNQLNHLNEHDIITKGETDNGVLEGH